MKYDNDIPSWIEYMIKILQWFILSSADPNKFALTVKGLLVAIIPAALYVLNKHFGFDFFPQDMEQLAIDISGIVAAGLTIVGLVRKIYLTFKK